MIKGLHIKSLIESELNSISKFWKSHSVDHQNGGFIGQIDYKNQIQHNADKGAVLHARILWSFSAMFQYTNLESDLEMAKKAYSYIVENFIDVVHGGIFWSLDYNGSPKDTKNQIYALAFMMYGLTEYYKVSHDDNALILSINLFQKIEKHSFDEINGGYFEAFTRDWKPLEDLRLSEKDANEKKTMNTHLHIIEAYANLYLVWKSEKVKSKIEKLLEVFEEHFINKTTWHLNLFFDENWNSKDNVISYGHDIEAAWLLLWCAKTINHNEFIEKYQNYAVKIAHATKEGLDSDGGLWYEFDPSKNELIKEKHWWPQAELWIGMINAFEISKEIEFYNIFEKNIYFVKDHILDHGYGEWHWGIKEDYSKIEKDKIGFWKCPYHNTRACLELLSRIE
jgi:mannobiose 2-epimerase